MVIRNRATIIVDERLLDWRAQGMGSKSAISRSKRRKVIAIRKNFIENGSRADPKGSNPHS